jgi:sugar O-acyltransferase (sialic acid O-acetyltransferase NeuD family)
MTSLIGIYGASGFGREVAPLVKQAHAGATIVFLDDAPKAKALTGLPVWTFDRFLGEPAAERSAAIAIADSHVRQKLDQRCRDAGVAPLAVRHPSVVELDDVVIGDGAVLCSVVTLTSTILIGRSFHANIYSYVAHDCRIGDFVTFAPAAHCNGRVVIEDYAYIGSAAVIKQGTPDKPMVIGKGAIVGMGAVVTKSVPPYTTVVGNPAAPLARRENSLARSDANS